MSMKEVYYLANKYYLYLLDLTLETFKMLTISRASVMKMVDLEGQEKIKKYLEQKRSMVMVMGHLGNWELAGIRIASDLPCPLYAIYHPLENPRFNQLLKRSRERHNITLIPMKEAARFMLRDKNNFSVMGFVADQTPSYTDAHWMMFLHQETLVFRGPALMAQRLNQPIIYVAVRQPSRGRYICTLEVLVDDPTAYTIDQMTQIYMRRLEKNIEEQPEIWLWSHRRWKHEKPKEIQIRDLTGKSSYLSAHV